MTDKAGTDKLADKVNDILQSSIQAAAHGAEFLKDQIPDVVKQLLLWNLCYCVLNVIFVLITVPFLVYIIKWSVEMPLRNITGVVLMISGTLALVVCPAIVGNLYNLVKIIVAPKVWLLEYAAKLIRR